MLDVSQLLECVANTLSDYYSLAILAQYIAIEQRIFRLLSSLPAIAAPLVSKSLALASYFRQVQG